MITNLNKLDSDVQKWRDEQLDDYLNEDTERCSLCGNYYAKDDMSRVHGDWICENCQKGVGE
jgi:formylmethanofuran dehydrogenase subunit E